MLIWSTKFLSLEKQYDTDNTVELVKQSEQAIDDIQSCFRTHTIDCVLSLDRVYDTGSNKAKMNI